MKRIIYFILITISIIVSLYIFNSSNEKQSIKSKFKLTHKRNPTLIKNSDGSYSEIDESFSLFDRDDLLSYDSIIEKAKTGELRLISELWKLRRNCPKELTQDECDKKIIIFIMEKYPDPDNKKLAALIQSYQGYEKKMRALMKDDAMPKNFQERYEFTKQKRIEILGKENAKLIFGMEEAKIDFQSKYKQFLEDSSELSGDERMKKYEELRKESYGDYYDYTNEIEPKFDKYNTEVLLRKNDIENLEPDDKNGKINSLREKYFGEEGALRMAEVDKQIEENNKKIQAYESAEKTFLLENSSLSKDEISEKLKELRISFLGKEEAGAYLRRKKYETSLGKKK